MPLPCRSPFVYCRIRWDGEVDFCNRRDQVIGNINDNKLIDIWNGDNAQSLRQKISAGGATCNSCDYFKFCIDSRHVDFSKDESYFSSGIFDNEITKDFITSTTLQNP